MVRKWRESAISDYVPKRPLYPSFVPIGRLFARFPDQTESLIVCCQMHILLAAFGVAADSRIIAP